jgi:putative transposase
MTLSEKANWLRRRREGVQPRPRLRELLRWAGLSAASFYRHGAVWPDRRRSGPPPGAIAEWIRTRIVETARKYAVLGYKKIHAVLLREGLVVSRKIVFRVMREEGLLKPRRMRQAARQAARARLRELQPKRPNQLWQMDVTHIFVPRYGFWFQIDVMDYFSRYLLAQRFTWSYSAAEGVHAIRQAVAEAERIHGSLKEPVFLLTDNGSTFIARRFSRGLEELLTEEGADLLRHIRIGYRMPEHLGLLERFHGTLKAEAVWPNWFLDPLDARRTLTAYGEFYNYDRPHWALGLKTPAEIYANATWHDVQSLRSPVLEAVA